MGLTSDFYLNNIVDACKLIYRTEKKNVLYNSILSKIPFQKFLDSMKIFKCIIPAISINSNLLHAKIVWLPSM